MMQQKTLTLLQLAELTNSKLVGNPGFLISGVADLDSAASHEASFLANPRYEQAMLQSQAGVVFIDEKTQLPPNRNFLISENPSRAFQMAVEAFYGDSSKKSGFTGIHSSAVIHPTAKLGENVNIGPHVVIDEYAVIGEQSSIGAGSYIGAHSSLGTHCLIHPNVTIRENCKLGNRVLIQSGAVIGSCGFGFTTDQRGQHTRLAHVGCVIIEDDVEIGGNTVIEKARFQKTEIRQGTKISNLVIIGHNVQIGKHTLIIGQTGVAGSTKIGNHVLLAAQVGVAGHIEIADGTKVAACAGVSKSLPKGDYSGVPAVPIQTYSQRAVLLRNITTHVQNIKELQKKVAELEEKVK
jgi:UDP-3-O-[3-hydroxymyristoyl] glucosamine N-acyltransferase